MSLAVFLVFILVNQQFPGRRFPPAPGVWMVLDDYGWAVAVTTSLGLPTSALFMKNTAL
jgi:hypothetical protein